MAATAWSLLVLSAPFLGSPAARGTGGLGLSLVAYLAGNLVCHQQPARSFHLAGAPLPVCARCTGVYLSCAGGLMLGAFLFGWLPRHRAQRPDRDAVRWRLVLGLCAVPMALSLALEWAGVWAGTNQWRAVSAVPLGLAVGALVAESLSFQGRL